MGASSRVCTGAVPGVGGRGSLLRISSVCGRCVLFRGAGMAAHRRQAWQMEAGGVSRSALVLYAQQSLCAVCGGKSAQIPVYDFSALADGTDLAVSDGKALAESAGDSGVFSAHRALPFGLRRHDPAGGASVSRGVSHSVWGSAEMSAHPVCPGAFRPDSGGVGLSLPARGDYLHGQLTGHENFFPERGCFSESLLSHTERRLGGILFWACCLFGGGSRGAFREKQILRVFFLGTVDLSVYHQRHVSDYQSFARQPVSLDAAVSFHCPVHDPVRTYALAHAEEELAAVFCLSSGSGCAAVHDVGDGRFFSETGGGADGGNRSVFPAV